MCPSIKIFISYGKSECLLEKGAYEASCDNQYREWQVNLTYAKHLEKELKKYMQFECMGPLRQEDGQLVYAEMENKVIEKFKPDLIIKIAVEYRRIHLFEKWIKQLHRKEEEKYQLTLPLYPADELISLAEYLDENLTKRLRVNNFIETKPLPYSKVIQYSPGNLFIAEDAERMMRHDNIHQFCLILIAAIQSVYRLNSNKTKE